jgi:hypothetical protein
VELEARHQIRRMERLRDGVRGPIQDQPRLPVQICGARDVEERDVAPARARVLHPEQLVAIQLRQLEVAEHHIHRMCHQQLEALEAVLRLQHPLEDVRALESGAHLGACPIGIIDDEQSGHCALPVTWSIGRPQAKHY